MVAVCQLTEGHPFYTQHLCHLLWEIPVERSRKIRLRSGSAWSWNVKVTAYATLSDSLPLSQRRFPSSLATSPKGSQTILSGVLAALSSRAGIHRATGSSRLALT